MGRAINRRLPGIWHGGDSNPEQWPAATWDDDVGLMQVARYKVATGGVFARVSIQPAEDPGPKTASRSTGSGTADVRPTVHAGPDDPVHPTTD